MRISSETIDRIRTTARIEEVVSDYVTLKRKGMNEWACCPFHAEKTPSFSVSPAKGIYKCFGCGKAGDAVRFVMDIEGLGYVEALKHLGKKYGIEVAENEVSDSEQQAQNEKEALLILMGFASKHFHQNLSDTEEGRSIGYSYFKERGFNDSTIGKFELGYSLDAWDDLLKTAKKAGYSEDKLLEAGLILDNEGKKYDRFRGRVIFPIHNLSGRVIAFGARTMRSDKNQPKYINSPETILYHKSNILYGIHQSRQSIRQYNNCYLVEGYTDVISLHQGGVENVVASSGTSLTIEQIRLIKRFADTVTVLYDGDTAGIKASFRGIDLLLEEGLHVMAISFADGEDPDSFIRKVGAVTFRDYLQNEAKDFLSFKLEITLKEAGNDPVRKAVIIRDIVESISKIPDPIQRTLFIRQCSDKLLVAEDILIIELNKILIQRKRKGNELGGLEPPTQPHQTKLDVEAVSSSETSVQEDTRIYFEKEIARLLLRHGNTMIDESRTVTDFLLEEISGVELCSEQYGKLIGHIKERNEAGEPTTLEYFMDQPDDTIRAIAIELSSERYELSDGWSRFSIYVPKEDEILSTILVTTLLRLKWRNVKHFIKENQQEMRTTDTIEDIEKHQKLHINLKNIEREIAGKLGNVIA